MCELCCECGTPWGPGQTWKTSYRFQSRALILHVVSTSLPRVETIPRFQLLQFIITPEVDIQSFHLFRFISDGFPLCFSVPALLAAACVWGKERVDYAHFSRLKGEWRNWYCGERTPRRGTDRAGKPICNQTLPIITLHLQFSVWFVTCHLRTPEVPWPHASRCV